jgi:hypothetical protein
MVDVGVVGDHGASMGAAEISPEGILDLLSIEEAVRRVLLLVLLLWARLVPLV